MLKFKRKSSFLLIILLIVSILAMGCSKNTPEAKVDKLFKSAKKLDIKGMEEVLETDPEKALEDELDENIEDLDLEDYIEMAKDMKEMDGLKEAVLKIKEFQGKLDYEILEVVEEGSSATVTVDAKYVDGSIIGKETLSTVMGRVFTDSISNVFEGAFSGKTDIEDFDEEAEFKKYTQIALDAFNESANTYETKMTSNVFEMRLNQDESGEWLISEEESDKVLFSALFFNFINLELIDQYIENFS